MSNFHLFVIVGWAQVRFNEIDQNAGAEASAIDETCWSEINAVFTVRKYPNPATVRPRLVRKFSSREPRTCRSQRRVCSESRIVSQLRSKDVNRQALTIASGRVDQSFDPISDGGPGVRGEARDRPAVLQAAAITP